MAKAHAAKRGDFAAGAGGRREKEMKQKKKWLGFMLAAGMAAALSACSSAETEETTAAGTGAQTEAQQEEPAAEETSGEGVTLSLYYWDILFKEEIEQLIADYEAQNEGITIEPTQLPWADYWTKLETMLATGDDAPDIFWVNLAHLIEYLPAGYMLPLNDDVMELDKYSQAATDLLKGDDGSYYGVPFLLDPNVLIYNKAMFDEAGLEYPTEDWTWDDFRTAAAALTKDDGSQYGYCFRIDTGQGSMHEWLVSAGNDEFDWNNSIPLFAEESGIDGWSFVYDLMYTDGSTPTGAQMTEIQGDTYFQSGQAAMVFGAPPKIVTYAEALGAENIGVSTLPEGARKACSFSVCSMAGYSGTQHEEEVQNFLKYAASQEGMTTLSAAGLTAHLDCFDVYEETLGIDVAAIQTTLENYTLVPILYSVGHNTEFQDQFNSCIGEVYLTTGLDRAGIQEIVQRYADQCTAMTQ